MRLSKLAIQNYRSCYQTEVCFSEHFTLLVGENDGGKSNIVDALRTAVQPTSGRPSIWFDSNRDLGDGLVEASIISVRRTYTDLTETEDSIFTPVLIDDSRDLVHTTFYNTDATLPRRHRLANRVGNAAVEDPEPENRNRIAHVYLPPLRDAARVLDSGGGNRLADVFRAIVSQLDIEEFEEDANKVLKQLAAHQASNDVIAGVQRHLTAITEPVERRVVDVEHRQLRLNSLARSLRLHMAAEGLTPRDLLGSGLGYANLLYMATIMLELEKAPEYDLVLLLVEEPEAHLHPQLQSVLLAYLLDHAQRSGESDGSDAGLAPAGRIQVIATSHSPQLASSLSTKNIVVVRATPIASSLLTGETSEETQTDPSKKPSADSDDSGPLVNTSAIALSEVDLKDPARRKIDRYLDATKASLLFARQVILVEGVAESILLRTFAENLVYPESADSDDKPGKLNRQSRHQFSAITIVPVGGVDFMPYLKILLAGDGRLVDRVVVVTDGDKGAGTKRQTAITAAFKTHVDAGKLVVAVGTTTLEAELFAAVSNEALLREAFKAQHPQSLAKWDAVSAGAGSSPDERGRVFSEHLKSGHLDLGKGDFAHVLSDLVCSSDKKCLLLPEYLRLAITAAVIPPREVDLGQKVSQEDG